MGRSFWRPFVIYLRLSLGGVWRGAGYPLGVGTRPPHEALFSACLGGFAAQAGGKKEHMQGRSPSTPPKSASPTIVVDRAAHDVIDRCPQQREFDLHLPDLR